jgi:DNA invertase Pin-like site-specific DNA recombinase
MPRAEASRKRCAIYTRKSSEEGLEQEFNSLAAQREACEALIRSQQHEGWVLSRTRYDDGGFSGGNMGRPALQRLLEDVRAGRIDIIVVYKVDRLTRSLADFARLVEIFDAQGVSFVSVTQQFNTTSSMGRLTLNVLLSFAQFEREVTGERIRDKIVASKQKGLWDEADRLRLRTKRSTTADGSERGGKPFSRGHIYSVLSNPVYTGHIAHKGQLYPGQHPALIEHAIWTAVRERLAVNNGAHRRQAKAAAPSLLAGLLFDTRGERLIPSHAVKNGRRYRYYVSAAMNTGSAKDGNGWRLAADQIDRGVTNMLIEALTSPAGFLDRFGISGIPGDEIRKVLGRATRLAAALSGSPEQRVKTIRDSIEQVMVEEDRISIKVRRSALLGRELAAGGADERDGSTIELSAAVAFRRRGAATRLVFPGSEQPNRGSRCDPALIKAITRGRAWFEELATGRSRSLQEIAAREGINRRYIRRLVSTR